MSLIKIKTAGGLVRWRPIDAGKGRPSMPKPELMRKIGGKIVGPRFND